MDVTKKALSIIALEGEMRQSDDRLFYLNKMEKLSQEITELICRERVEIIKKKVTNSNAFDRMMQSGIEEEFKFFTK